MSLEAMVSSEIGTMIQKKKWTRKIGLNKKGSELVNLFDKCQSLDEKDKEIYRFYIQNKLKFNLDLFDNYATSRELEAYLLNEKNFLITKKEQLEDAVEFIFSVLNNDMVNLSAHTDARTDSITLTHIIELTKEKADNIFYDCVKSWTTSSVSSFVHQFVNQYMIKNANSYLACCSNSGKFSIKTEPGRSNTFSINFTFKADDLDEEMLEEIGTIIMNMPSFA